MPSMRESREKVDAALSSQMLDIDHDAVLASLQNEIDQHNAVKDDLRYDLRSSRRSRRSYSPERASPRARFRFKTGVDLPRSGSKHHSSDRGSEHKRQRRDAGRKQRSHKDKKQAYPSPPQEADDDNVAHPFPREPTDPLRPEVGSQDAFRESLFDALADDEGAAYWESVYSQPIHVYSRPTVKNEHGESGQMNDDEYVDYVKTKMWERKHPEIVLERERSERKRRRAEEERTKEREEFVRRKEQAAWEKTQRRRYRDRDDKDGGQDHQYDFAGEANCAPKTSERQTQEYVSAWSRYVTAWDQLKNELLAQHNGNVQANPSNPAKRIPWPVIADKPVIKSNIEDFMRRVPADDQRTRLQLLKAERVRWHPDKVQQRFAGQIDGGTMKVVTGVFQVVDGLVEEERKRNAG